MEKKYQYGMYGGKFCPMHKGHLHCLKVASEMCEKVYLVLVIGGKNEEDIRKTDKRAFLSVEYRQQQIKRAARMFHNVIPVTINVSDCRDADGEEDWDMETPIMLNAVGHFDAVFGSEPEYGKYFNRAYPWADYILVDQFRQQTPISATEIRNNMEGMKKWIV